jgi:hypothetical protein
MIEFRRILCPVDFSETSIDPLPMLPLWHADMKHT